MALKIYVGLSGGVDSSVTAYLLKEAGYDVTGVYMKNWSKDLPGFDCPWREDYQDAKRIAVELDIPFKMYDFESQYRQKVVDYMLEGYQAGITPNPDIMCNQEVKFKLFLDSALADGADLIATGHYSRILRSNELNPSDELVDDLKTRLYVAKDKNKDQSYFLHRVSGKALSKSLMPIGEMENKAKVREVAKQMGLITADKKDSQGICFVGKVGIKDFLLAELGEQDHGNIVDSNGQVIGQHEGALFYTIGQRHGLDVGGGLPYYVTGKDMAKNEVYVSSNIADSKLWKDELSFTNLHLINEDDSLDDRLIKDAKLYARLRYRAPLVKVESLSQLSDNSYSLRLANPERAISPGQSVVFYEGDKCLGGGVIN